MQKELNINAHYAAKGNDPFTIFHNKEFRAGLRDGFPIALAYFTVAFTLGITASSLGLTALQGLLTSLLNNASVGQYAGFALMAAGASFGELVLVTVISNARFALLGCSLSQKLAPDTPLRHRLLIAFDLTDELFGLAMARSGYLAPYYYFGAMLVTMPAWAVGTMIGVLAGDLMPLSLASAFSVALYGMFLVVIVPPARKNPVVGGLVAFSFAASFLVNRFGLLDALSSSTQIILLTVVIAGLAAAFFPVSETAAESGTETNAETPLEAEPKPLMAEEGA